MISDTEKVEKLISLCEKYRDHLYRETQLFKEGVAKAHWEIDGLKDTLSKKNDLTSFSKKEIAKIKCAIVWEMLEILRNPDMKDDNKILYIKDFLNCKGDYGLLTPASILSTKRSPAGMQFLEKILHVLTIGIYSLITKGTPAFWKSHGEATVDAIENIVGANSKIKN